MRSFGSMFRASTMAIAVAPTLVFGGGVLLRSTPAAADSVSWITVDLVGCGSKSCDFKVNRWSGDWDQGVAFKLTSSGTMEVMDEFNPFPPHCSTKSNPNGASLGCDGVPSGHVLVRVTGCGATTLQAFISSDNIGQATGVISCPPSSPPCPPLQVLKDGACVPAYTSPPSCDQQSQVQKRDGTCRCRYAGWVLHGSSQPGQGWCFCPLGRDGQPLGRCAVPLCAPGLTWQWISGGGGACSCPGLNYVPVGPYGPYCPPPAGARPSGPMPGPAPQPNRVPMIPSHPTCGPDRTLSNGHCCPFGTAWNGGRCRSLAISVRVCPSGYIGRPPNCRPFHNPSGNKRPAPSHLKVPHLRLR
jgi:hypothetical protein